MGARGSGGAGAGWWRARARGPQGWPRGRRRPWRRRRAGSGARRRGHRGSRAAAGRPGTRCSRSSRRRSSGPRRASGRRRRRSSPPGSRGSHRHPRSPHRRRRAPVRRRRRAGSRRRRRRTGPEHRHAPAPVEDARAEQPAGGHRGQEDREAHDADPALEAVAVRERDRDPVVGRALGEGGREDDEADEQRARLEPGGADAGSRAHSAPVSSVSTDRGRKARRNHGVTTRSSTTMPRRCATTGTCRERQAGPDERADDGAGAEGRHGSAA